MSEWRILGPEEVIQEGDEIASRDVNNWFKCCTSIAGTVKDNSFDGAFQFRRRVSPGKEADAPIACCSVCHQMFSPSMLVEKTRAGCWKQRAEKAEALNGEANAALTWANEVLADYRAKLHQAEKINAEASRSAVRLASDAAARILQAEKERDEARIEAANYKAYGESIKSELVSTEKERDQLRAENERLRKHLELILPMAKGYAYQNPVGNNLQMVMDAQQALAAKGETK